MEDLWSVGSNVKLDWKRVLVMRTQVDVAWALVKTTPGASHGHGQCGQGVLSTH